MEPAGLRRKSMLAVREHIIKLQHVHISNKKTLTIMKKNK